MSPYYEGGAGYILMRRTAQAGWLWANPVYFRWWTQIVMAAAWSPCECSVSGARIRLLPGQLAIPLRELAEKLAWEDFNGAVHVPEVKTVRKFLRRLSEGGEVRLGSIADCQASGPRGVAEEGPGEGGVPQRCTTEVYHRAPTTGKRLSGEFTRTTVITIVNYADYQTFAGGSQQGCTTGAEEPLDGGCTTEGVPQRCTTEVYHIYKEINNKKNNKKNILTTAREREGDEKAQAKESFRAELEADEIFWENAAMAMRKAVGEIKPLLESYHREELAVGTERATYSDYRRGFFNWLRREERYSPQGGRGRKPFDAQGYRMQVAAGVREQLERERRELESNNGELPF